MPLTWIGLALLSVAGTPETTPSPEVRQQYQEQQAHAGRTPDDQVRLALWCEAHGLQAERLRHLARAVLTDPAHATARGLMGLVEYGGKWQAPDSVADRVKADAAQAQLLADYDTRRSGVDDTAESQWRLAVWCEEQGLADQARAHFTAVTRLDPSRDAAWKRLGYTKRDGRWVTDAQVEAERAEAEAQKKADRHWKPQLERWRTQLNNPARRGEAETALLAVTDPRAVPMIAQVFAKGRPADQATAVRVLAGIEGVAASRVLANLAVASGDANVRRSAVETLRHRDPREFVRLWIRLLQAPVHYEVKRVGGPDSPGELFIEGQKADLRRVYQPASLPDFSKVDGARLATNAQNQPVIEVDGTYWTQIFAVPQNPQGQVGPISTQGLTSPNRPGLAAEVSKLLDKAVQDAPKGITLSDLYYTTPEGPRPLWMAPQGLLVELGRRSARNIPFTVPIRVDRTTQIPVEQLQAEARTSAAVAQQQMDRDIATLDQGNAAIRTSNGPIVQALNAVTGVSLGDDPMAWSRWTTDREGYAFVQSETQKPTMTEQVSTEYIPLIAGRTIDSVRPRSSCFAAGTKVRTIDGSRPIERIGVGDRVLVQDTTTGGLKYQPVVAVAHNPPSPTLKIGIGGDTVVATGIHRFWKAGQGWAMARDLKVGDVIRTLGGAATVTEVTDAPVQPVFNLEVADGRSYFVGSAGALVHDNSLVETTPRPFDAPREVAQRAD